MIPTVAALILVTTAGKIGAEGSRPLAQRGTGMRFSNPASTRRSPAVTSKQTVKTLRRARTPDDFARVDEVRKWPGVSTKPTPRGSTAIVLEGHFQVRSVPVGAVALSPVTDLALSAGVSTRAPTRTAGLVHAYLGVVHPKNPMALPI